MGNGESTKFWLDHWHTRGIFKDIFPRLYALESSKDVTVSSKIGDTSLVCSFRRIPRGGIEQNQFDSLVECSVTIVPLADRWNWNLESMGIFSVASARRRIDEICLPNIGEETRWVKCVPIKINVLAWKIKTDALPTRFNISRRGIDIQDMSCPICDNAIESTDHLLIRFVELLWQLSLHVLREVHRRTYAADVARIALERRRFLKNAETAVQRQAMWSNLAHEMTEEYRGLCAEEAYLQQELEKLHDLRNKVKMDLYLAQVRILIWFKELLACQHEVLASGPIEDLIAQREHR
ncbi:RNA-directed DNA polymerase, eukaryota [Tanacetum coccineum]